MLAYHEEHAAKFIIPQDYYSHKDVLTELSEELFQGKT